MRKEVLCVIILLIEKTWLKMEKQARESNVGFVKVVENHFPLRSSYTTFVTR